MSNKKKSKKQFPFNNEIKILKESFKKSIDDMPDRDFIDLLSFIMFASEDFEDEDWHLMKNGKMKQTKST